MLNARSLLIVKEGNNEVIMYDVEDTSGCSELRGPRCTNGSSKRRFFGTSTASDGSLREIQLASLNLEGPMWLLPVTSGTLARI